MSGIDSSWSEKAYQLAWWAWKKWRFHRMTSLRVGFIKFVFISDFYSLSTLAWISLVFIITIFILHIMILRQRFYAFPLNRIIQIVFNRFG